MRSRTDLLITIIREVTPSADVLTELKAYGWDCDAELVKLTQDDILRVMDSFISGEISAIQASIWANRLEHRDDVGFDGGGDGVVNEALFWLANPEINYPIDNNLYQRILKMFEAELSATSFQFATDEESLAYLQAIVNSMVQLFGVESEDCIECINQAWSDMPIVSDADPVYRESPNYWANHFMYGKESIWWSPNREFHGPLKPLPYWSDKIGDAGN